VLLQASQCCPTFDGPVTAQSSILPVCSFAWWEFGGDLFAARVLPAGSRGGVQGMRSRLAPRPSGWQWSRRAVRRSPPPRPHL
jgi:hypothetical protein